MLFLVSASCWTRQGRKSEWSTQLDAADQPAALDQADRILARAGHYRYDIKVRPAAAPIAQEG
jgi:hypothetical protein